MKYFCTLSDINYLPKGLALYKSLTEVTKEPFTLYYLSMDDAAAQRLEKLALPNIIVHKLSDIEKEKEELRIARSNRPYNEYCWTLASYYIYYLTNVTPNDHITYIDSDIYFYQDPEIIYQEIGNKSVGIIAHRHNSVGDRDGAYNVGVIYFKNNEMGKKVLFWWMDAVLNKKYPEYMTCGDQKYLEGFIPLFGEENICVADKTFAHGAPWNYRLYTYEKAPEGKITWNGKEQLMVFNHFSRFSYDVNANSINFTSGQYGDHILGGKVFQDNQEVVNYYLHYFEVLKEIHSTWMVDKAPAFLKPLKVSIGMIVFEGDYVLRQSLESIYPFAHQILVAEGPVKYWQDQGRTTSTDLTNEILDSFPDPDNKIKIVHGQFAEKDDQCKAYMQHLDPEADYIWNLDSDEVFKQDDIEALLKLIKDHKYTSVGVKSCSFYGGFERHIGGFEEARDQFLRIFKVYPGSTWLTHRPPTIVHKPETPVLDLNHLDSDTLFNEHKIGMYHYSYVFPRQVKNKIEYYKNALTKHKCIDNYWESVYLPWINGSIQQKMDIEKQYQGVHEWKPEYRAPAYTKPFLGEHPYHIQKAMSQLLQTFNEQK